MYNPFHIYTTAFHGESLSLRVGADVGGTFTDVVLIDEHGRVRRHKTLSTPPHYEFAVLEGISHLMRNGDEALAADIVEVSHGTTVATNAVLEHRGARTALITTRGFRDVLELRRVRAPQMYNLFFDKPRPLVERHLRYEITERLSAAGEVLTALDEAELEQLEQKISNDAVQSVAVCLLHAYAYPRHENKIGSFLRARLPHVDVTLSCEVLRERREYERTATTVVNAYIRPVMKRYLGALGAGLEGMGIRAPLLIMQSTGGLTPERDAAERPVYALESGPAAGVLASLVRAKAAGLEHAITFDMGGTTAKASLIENGQVHYSSEYEVGASLSAGNLLVGGGGERIRAPSIDIAEVGAGGGSIASVDSEGRLHVGPRSAGAEPGPACYCRGGSEPTVTDANVVLGYIRPGQLADGSIRIDLEAARRSVYDRVARPLSLSLLEAAEGIHRIANARIMRALRAVSTQRGRDPRQFALIAFGGSGPVHAAPLAQELCVGRTLIPPLPGLFSAVGLLSSRLEHHDVRSCFLTGDSLRAQAVTAICAELEQSMFAQFRAEGFDAGEVELQYTAEVRFRGQSSELRVTLDDAHSDAHLVSGLRRRFERDYQLLYGHSAALDHPIEVVAVRLVGRVVRPQNAALHSTDTAPPSSENRQACFNGRLFDTPVVTRSSLAIPHPGPLLIDEYDSTTAVPPGMLAWIDESQNILLEPHYGG